MKEFFDENSIKYALIGGLALSAYGYTRFTNDVDFIVEAEGKEKILTYLTSLGFKTLQEDNSFSIHTLLGERLDCMYIEGVTSERIFQTTKIVSIMDIELPVVSAIHLSMMKAFANAQDPTRVQDLNDIKELYLRKAISEDELENIIIKYNCRDFFIDILKG